MSKRNDENFVRECYASTCTRRFVVLSLFCSVIYVWEMAGGFDVELICPPNSLIILVGSERRHSRTIRLFLSSADTKNPSALHCRVEYKILQTTPIHPSLFSWWNKMIYETETLACFFYFSFCIPLVVNCWNWIFSYFYIRRIDGWLLQAWMRYFNATSRRLNKNSFNLIEFLKFLIWIKKGNDVELKKVIGAYKSVSLWLVLLAVIMFCNGGI